MKNRKIREERSNLNRSDGEISEGRNACYMAVWSTAPSRGEFGQN